MISPRSTSTHSEAQTAAVGRELGSSLSAGDTVLLYGDLGAGKTAFVRGLAEGLGIDPDEVSSPTFTLVQEYAGTSLTLYHVDLYRLDSAEVDDLGLDDLLDSRGIVAIEWAERWPGRPRRAIDVQLEESGEGRRRIRVARPD